MSINTQKIIRFIPIVNFICAFLWLASVVKSNLPGNYVFRPIIKIAIPVVVIFIVRIIICEIINITWVTSVLTWLSIYIAGLIFAFVAVNEQEKLNKAS